MKKYFKIVLIVGSVLGFIYLLITGITLFQMQLAFNSAERNDRNKIIREVSSGNQYEQIKNFKATDNYKKVNQMNNIDSTLKYFVDYINSKK